MTFENSKTSSFTNEENEEEEDDDEKTFHFGFSDQNVCVCLCVCVFVCVSLSLSFSHTHSQTYLPSLSVVISFFLSPSTKLHLFLFHDSVLLLTFSAENV